MICDATELPPVLCGHPPRTMEKVKKYRFVRSDTSARFRSRASASETRAPKEHLFATTYFVRGLLKTPGFKFSAPCEGSPQTRLREECPAQSPPSSHRFRQVFDAAVSGPS